MEIVENIRMVLLFNALIIIVQLHQVYSQQNSGYFYKGDLVNLTPPLLRDYAEKFDYPVITLPSKHYIKFKTSNPVQQRLYDEIRETPKYRKLTKNYHSSTLKPYHHFHKNTRNKIKSNQEEGRVKNNCQKSIHTAGAHINKNNVTHQENKSEFVKHYPAENQKLKIGKIYNKSAQKKGVKSTNYYNVYYKDALLKEHILYDK